MRGSSSGLLTNGFSLGEYEEKHKRAKTDEEKQTIEIEIIEISKQITPIAEEIKHCKNIFQRVEKIKQHQLHE